MARSPQHRFRFSLDALNFLLADVRGALGPFLNVFLVTQQHWSQSSVGFVTMVGGLVGLVIQTPVGAAIDATKAKRALLVVALVVLAAGGIVFFLFPQFWPVMIANTAMAAVGDIFAPAVSAITLGLFPLAALARRMGRNSAWDHAGNVASAALAGLLGWAFSQRAVFLLVPAFAVLASAAVLSIPGGAIDHKRARGGGRTGGPQTRDPDKRDADKDGADEGPSSWRTLVKCRPLLVFGGCALLFHFANAPLLPLVGQKLAFAHKGVATAMMSACIIAAQAIMLPVALLVGRFADRIGRKPILLIAYVVLPVRAALYTLSDNSAWLIGVQLLDGVGAGIFSAIAPLLIADLMRGTGRYNLAQGAVATMQGIGASVSSLMAGEIVDHAGYSAAFLSCSAAAALALSALVFLMPETMHADDGSGDTQASIGGTKPSPQTAGLVAAGGRTGG